MGPRTKEGEQEWSKYHHFREIHRGNLCFLVPHILGSLELEFMVSKRDALFLGNRARLPLDHKLWWLSGNFSIP